MEKFIFKKEKFEIEYVFNTYKDRNFGLCVKDLRVNKVISVPECYKELSPDQIQPIVEYFYLEELTESAVLSLEE